MSYDPELAARVRDVLADTEAVTEAVTEQKMFGGLAFLLNGNMAVAAARSGGLLVRVGTTAMDDAVRRPHAAPMEMHGRTMAGWVIVAPAALTTDAQLAEWIGRALTFTRTLAPK